MQAWGVVSIRHGHGRSSLAAATQPPRLGQSWVVWGHPETTEGRPVFGGRAAGTARNELVPAYRNHRPEPAGPAHQHDHGAWFQCAGPGSSVVIVDRSAPASVASTGVSTPDGDPSQRAGGAAASAIVVDVEGGVARPGLVRLAAGSRVADAIAAAGGYAPSVDVARAASELNLAARVADGERVRIPALGDPQTILSPAADAAGTPDGVTAGGATGGAIGPAGVSGGLVDINRATAEQLDTLPGIGPATAGKILDARAAAPFTRTSDLRDRKVVSAATYAKIEGLITVGP